MPSKGVGVSGWWSTPLIQYSGGRAGNTTQKNLVWNLKNVCVCGWAAAQSPGCPPVFSHEQRVWS